MNNTAIIERLARFIGLEIVDMCSHCEGTGTKDAEGFRECRWCDGSGKRRHIVQSFDPLKDYNHCRMVEERIMEEGKGELCKKYLAFWDSKAAYISSGCKERMMALISILDNQNN